MNNLKKLGRHILEGLAFLNPATERGLGVPPKPKERKLKQRKSKTAAKQKPLPRRSSVFSSPDKLIVSPAEPVTGFGELIAPLQPNRSASRYKVIKKLGQGGNGVVELAKDRRVGTLVAIKTLSHSRARNYVPNEVKILDQLGQHANITQYHTAFMQAEKDDGTGKLFSKIVFEYASLGDLHTYINTNYKKAPVPEMFLWHILHEISAGLAHMHSLGIIHGDLKPMNILCLPSPSNSLWPALKIADFGTSVVQPPVDIPRAHMGTMGFIPPESAKFYGPETDIFALGCSIHLVAHKFGPWKEAKSRGVNDRTWLALQQSAIPRNVPHLEVYKTMLVWMGKHDLVVKPLNSWTKGTARRWSKLLNYIMLRALDEQWESRISAEGLMAVVPALQNFALKALQWGHADLLDFFAETGEQGKIVPVTVVVQQLVQVTMLTAKALKSERLVTLAESLVPLTVA